MVKFSDDDRLYNKIKHDLGVLDTLSVKVGYIEDARPGKKDKNDNSKRLSISEIILIGVYNEFGVKNKSLSGSNNITSAKFDSKRGQWKIRPRPHISAGIDANEKKLLDEMDKLLALVAAQKIDPNFAMKILGELGINKIKKFMIDLKHPKNAPLTIAIKGFDNPLIWSGQLKNTVNYKVGKE